MTSGLVMLSFPADEKPLAQQGERLSHWLNALAERAEREGVRYGVAFDDGGWRSVAEAGRESREQYALPDGVALRLSVEGQTVALAAEAALPQVWLYPGRNHGVQRGAIPGQVSVAIAGARLLCI
ncbi:hypothetical protein IC615_10230 [Serratia ureilytica]